MPLYMATPAITMEKDQLFISTSNEMQFNLLEDDIETLVDIDSIIWTTKMFRCKGSIRIYVIPPFQMKPEIFKHNHTYVEITIPQSEEDANMPGGRTEWLSKHFPMSAIPHICIGRISSAASTLNLYIAFPRMIHKHPVNGQRITLMLQEVLDIFWDRVLLLSIGACTIVSLEPYLKHTLEEAQYKAKGMGGHTGGWGPPKSIPLSNDDFGDGKGIKLLTKDGQRGSCGKLLVDIGISFTPHSPTWVRGAAYELKPSSPDPSLVPLIMLLSRLYIQYIKWSIASYLE
ncbi:hypothetical protein EDB19DRAFT_1831722 [Suillus lakei]|nr:hypothetical protein EDB19DRAFT_1831722 [Suillus lakei]